MIVLWLGDGKFHINEFEPVMRSCWKCNSAHEHLRNANTLHWCFDCGRYWIFGRYLDEFKTPDEIDAFFMEQGLRPGDATIAFNHDEAEESS